MEEIIVKECKTCGEKCLNNIPRKIGEEYYCSGECMLKGLKI